MAVDLSVFGRQKSVLDYQQLQQAFEQKKALQLAAIEGNMQTKELAAQNTAAMLQQRINPPLTQKDMMNFEIQKQKSAAADAKWERNADLKRELAGVVEPTIDPNTGETIPSYSNKPLPVGALKLQNDAIDALAGAKNAGDLSASIIKQIKDGELNLGPRSNMINTAQNYMGVSDKSSRAFGDLKTSLEKLRNDTLRLNKGVQTDGDAERAIKEVIENKNDAGLLELSMEKLNAINARGAELQRIQVNNVRQNYNVAPYNFDSVEGLSNAYDRGQPAGGAAPKGNDADRQRLEELRARNVGDNG